MIIPNKSITITRFQKVNGKTEYVDIIGTTTSAFIEPLSEDVMIGMDGMSAYEGFLLMSEFTNIQIGDKIYDGVNTYKVKGIKEYDSFIGNHIEAVIQKEYD